MKYHSFDFGDVKISGKIPVTTLERNWKLFNIEQDIAGKTVADLGCWDGYNSIRALQCGAKYVLAADNGLGSYNWEKNELKWKENAREALSHTQFEEFDHIDLCAIDLENDFTYFILPKDIVICAGLLYHLKNPFKFLERAFAILNDGGILCLETHVADNHLDYPSMRFYPTSELNNDPSNWWGPNILCVFAMLGSVGFNSVDLLYTSKIHNGDQRAIFKAYK